MPDAHVGNITFDELKIPGSFLFRSRQFEDARGTFWEALTQSAISEAVGELFPVAQVNAMTSVRGAIRGLHLSRVPPGQAKYLVCVAGEIRDAVADLRAGSPTFGRVEMVSLAGGDGQAIYIPPGVANGFIALSESATVVYVTTRKFDPANEFGINPVDPQLNIDWRIDQPILSKRDSDAPTLAELVANNELPDFARCVSTTLSG
ncbi:MAG: dTDP-4-dehydrorhamnose 3,5-epimerase family protein [Corynebacteriales bacterium]|nr:dTDP-4-dehydrorhamnose 3,5-epimerase family protein [Mycobacteriales bacterium]